MTYLKSLLLWIAGLSYFLVCFFVLVLSLAFFSRERTFRTAGRLFKGLLRIMGVRLKVEGAELIDPNKTYLLLGNHQSLFDVFVIPAAIPLVLTGVEAAYHFSVPVWGYLIRQWGCIPIQRSNLEEAKKSLALAKQTLAHGLSIAILPEGHRTRTGQMAPFKKGPFHLALATRATILPFGIEGLYSFQRRGGFILRPGQVTVRIGQPVPYSAYSHRSVDDLRDDMFSRIKTLSGE